MRSETMWKLDEMIFWTAVVHQSEEWSLQLAQLVEHPTGIAEVMGSNLVEALIFSGFFPIA